MNCVIAVLERLSDWVNAAAELLAILLTSLLIAMFLLGVSSRYFLDTPLIWLFETTMVVFIWSAALGFSIAFKRKEHIAVAFLSDHLSENARRVHHVVIDLLIIIFLAFVVVQSVEIVQDTSTQYYHTIPVSTGWLYAALPVCSLLSIIHLVPMVLRGLVGCTRLVQETAGQ